MFDPSTTASASVDSASRSTEDGRTSERVLVLPLSPLFAPVAEPSAAHPDAVAEIEGFAVAPDGTAILALAASGPEGNLLLHRLWTALQERGVGERWTIRPDDRGRTVAMFTLRMPERDRALEILPESLVLPVHVRAGFAELHLVTSSESAATLAGSLERRGVVPVAVVPGDSRSPTRTGLPTEDWAFLGLIQSAGLLAPGAAAEANAAAETLGMERAYFDRRLRRLESGLVSVVSTLFAPLPEPPDPGNPSEPPSPRR